MRDAGHQVEHHERCLSGTREPILREIMCWAKSAQGQPVFWLNGLAGTGKSTIAQTFAERASNEGILGASFFCSRDYSERKILKNIFPTLAYQLACRYTRFRSHLVAAIKRDPSVIHNSLISQLSDLLVDPLSATGISCTIIIDALDECIDDQPASAVLSVLGRLVSKLLSVKFFITGRPEPRIRSGFRLPLLEPFTQIFLLHEVDPTSVGGDIRLYLQEKLTAIAKRRSIPNLPESWPSDEDIGTLTQKSSGLFIFASTLVRFIESEYHEPQERLRLIVSKADDTRCEGASGIDSLYSQVLHDAFFGVNEESVFVNLKRILGTVVLALNPLSRDGLAKLLNIDSAQISATLRHLHSVLLVPTDGSKEIRVFHKSFPDFLRDRDRCPDARFNLDPKAHHGDMVINCLDLLGKLRTNPCSLPPFAMNQDITDLPQLLEAVLGSGLRYACKYWSAHLQLSPTSGEHNSLLTPSISRFFERGVFPWMEVMSLEGRLEDVIHSMNDLLDWLGKVSGGSVGQHRLGQLLTISNQTTGITDGALTRLTADCLRFTLHFFRPIRMSAQHIYHTALPLSPRASALRSLFRKCNPSWERNRTTWQATSGSSARWGGVLRTIKAESKKFTCMVVAGQRIAVADRSNNVNVYDAVTGVLKLALKNLQPVAKVAGSLDGSTLFCSHRSPGVITMWDTQTGGLIHTFTANFWISDIAVSSMGKCLASCSSDGTFRHWDVESRSGGSRNLGKPIVRICFLDPEDRVALALARTILVVEISTGRTLHTFSVFPTGGGVRGIAFSAHQHQLAIRSTLNEIAIIDTRTGMKLAFSAKSISTSVVSSAFPRNGDQIFWTKASDDLIWLNTNAYPLRQEDLDHLGTIRSIGLLRSGQLVVNVGESIQVLAKDRARPSSDPEHNISHVYPIDNGKAIRASSCDHERVYVLETETLFRRMVGTHQFDRLFMPRLLCASIDQRVVIFSFPGGNWTLFRLLNSLFMRYHGWKALFLQPVLFGALSPNGEKLVTVMVDESRSGVEKWELCVREVPSGKILSSITQAGGPPSNIAFTSETQFYTEHRPIRTSPEAEYYFEAEDGFETDSGDTASTTSSPSCYFEAEYDITSIISSASSEALPHTEDRDRDRYVRTTFTLARAPHGHGIREVAKEEVMRARQYYSLDQNLEWVVDAASRRVCWLPPGYVTGEENGHFFSGSSIVMAGKDGIVRKLTFTKPPRAHAL